MAVPIRFLSGRQQQQKIGIEGSTENQKVFEVIGRAGIGTVIFEPQSELDVRGEIRAENITVAEDLTIGGNLEVQGDLVTINVEEVLVEDKNIILGLTTTSTPTDFTASGGGISIASTEGNPLIVGLSTYDNYKQFSWYQAGSFTGLATDAWISNYAISVGTTSLESGIGLGVGTAVRIYNSGNITATSFVGDGSNITGLTADDVGALAGSTIREDGSIVGSASSVGDINFVSSNLTATASGVGATITLTDDPTFNDVYVTGVITATSFVGDGSNITGLTADDVGALAGSTIREDGSIVGSASSVGDINFVSSNLTATASGVGATITLTDDPTFNDVYVTGVITATSFVGISSFAKELRQDADGNIFAGDSTTGGGYDSGTGTACFNIFMGCNAGNSITDGDSNNFLGLRAGYCNTTGSYNNFLGQCAGYANTTGSQNNFLGFSAGRSNTTGTSNNFLGSCAGLSNTTGSSNNFLGSKAGFNNTTGSYNNFIGHDAGRCNTTGGCNNFLGFSAGRSNTTGTFNNFLGCGAGFSNTTGTGNNFLGASAGRCNTTGISNNFLGASAGRCNTTGSCNNFLGAYAGQDNTTGCFNNFFGYLAGRYNTTGSCNNFLGISAGRYNTTGGSNNFLGYFAGRKNTTGTDNFFVGACAGSSNTTGTHNNFLGNYAGKENTTGSCNNFLGSNAGCSNTTGSNNLAFGRNAGQTTGTPSGLINLTTSSNCIVMGNADHSCAAIQVAWTVISDIRDKCVYGDVPHGRGFLQNINPIKYSFKNRETNEVTDERVRYGFSAQEVAELEGDETIIASKSNIDKWGVTHEHLLPVLVNAIKELDVENQELKERLSSLEEKVNSLLNN